MAQGKTRVGKRVAVFMSSRAKLSSNMGEILHRLSHIKKTLKIVVCQYAPIFQIYLIQILSFHFFLQQKMSKYVLASSINPGSQVEKKQRTIPEQLNFIQKTYELINNQGNVDIIHWSKSGTSFVIEDIDRFQRELLSLYFRHNRYQSFVRQLNMYDFHKIRNGDYYCDNKSQFRHNQFSRDRYQLISQIKRKSFQCKNKDKKCYKNKKINKNGNKKLGKKKQMDKEKNKDKIKQEKVSSLEKQQNSFFVDLSIEGQNIEQFQKQTKQTSIQKIIKLVKQHYFTKSTKQLKKPHKIGQIIQLAQQVKDKWLQHMQKISSTDDIKTMKQIYYSIKQSLNSNLSQDKTTLTPPHTDNRLQLSIQPESKKSSQVEKQLEIDLFQMTDEQDALIESIFRAQIRSTLICITSQTVLNSQFLKNMDSIMGI